MIPTNKYFSTKFLLASSNAHLFPGDLELKSNNSTDKLGNKLSITYHICLLLVGHKKMAKVKPF